jgi:small subunit ribosomal protein S15
MEGVQNMSVTKEEKKAIIVKHGSSEKNTGKSEVQIALLTARITSLTEHLKSHTKDHSSRRGLLKLVGQRRSLLKYLKIEKLDAYRAIIAELNLRK